MQNAWTRRCAIAAGLSAIAAPALAMPGRGGKLSPLFKLTTFLEDDGASAFAAATATDARVITLNLVSKERTPDSPYRAILEEEFSTRRGLERRVKQAPESGALRVVSRSVIIRTPQEGKRGAKRIGLVGRGDGVTKQAFVRDWRDAHGPEVDKQPGLSGYLLNVCDGAQPSAHEWDGYAELWWPDWETWRTATAARLAQPSSQDFFARRLLLLVEEVEVTHR